MWDLLFGINTHDSEDYVEIPVLSKQFTQESNYLKTKRDELINADKLSGNKLLINNPGREISLVGPTVLIYKQKLCSTN